MTIGTTNIGVSTVRAELGKSYSAGDNISLKDMNTKWVAIDKSNASDSRFTLTGVGTMTSDDTVTSDQSDLDSNPSSLSEWKNYNRVTPITWDAAASNSTLSDTSVYTSIPSTSGGCSAIVQNSVELYCKRVSNDIVWYGGEGVHATGHITYIGNDSAITSDTEIARLAGAAADTSTTVSVAYGNAITPVNNIPVNAQATSSGSTSSNLVSTNTKIGYKWATQSIAECAIGGSTSYWKWYITFTVTVAGCEPRDFKFYTGYGVTAQTTYCC